MHIEQTPENGKVNFHITGSLSGTEKSTIHLFETVSITLESKPVEIVLNLARATYLDSMSIGLLVGILLKCKEKRVGFRIEGMPPHIQEVLDTVGLKKIFPQLY